MKSSSSIILSTAVPFTISSKSEFEADSKNYFFLFEEPLEELLVVWESWVDSSWSAEL